MATRAPTLEALLAEQSWLRRLARSVVRGEDLVDDAVQDALVSAWQRGQSPASLPAWLWRVVRNKALTRLQGEARRRRRERAAARPEATPAADAVVDQFQLQLRVATAVEQLAEPYRTAILLRFWEDLPPRAIAARCAAPVETVRTRLKRGLQLLRERLDRDGGGRSAWLAPLTAWLGPAALGESVARGAVSMWFGGVLMSVKAKLVLVVAAVAAVVVAWSVVTPGVPEATVAVPASRAAPESLPQGGPRVARSEVPAPPPPAAAPVVELDATTAVPDDEPVFVRPPFELALCTVDQAGRPVPDAEVEVWLGRRVSRGAAGNGYQGRLHSPAPYRVLRTNTAGEAVVSLDREFLYARGHKDGVGSSLDVRVGARGRGRAPLTLVLEPQVTVHGLVRGPDDLPVQAPIQATVREVLRGAWMPGEQRWTESPVQSDASGRFTVHLDVGHVVELVAVQGKDRSFPARVVAEQPGELQVILSFRGRLGIRGTVHGSNGAGAMGLLSVREVPPVDAPPRWQGHQEQASCDGHGGFLAFVPRAGRYELLATPPAATGPAAPDAPGATVLVTVADDQRFASATLELTRAGRCEGRVRTGQGASVAGAKLELVVRPDPDGAPVSRFTPAERYGGFAQVSGTEGSFAFDRLHPGASYVLRCTPRADHPEATLDCEPVTAGMTGLQVVVPDGFVGQAAGQVVDQVRRVPVPEFTLRVATGQSLSSVHRFADPEGRFALDVVPGLLPVLVVRAPGFAGAAVPVVGPGVDPAALRVALVRPGRLTVVVTDGQGAPVADVRVAAVGRAPLADALTPPGGATDAAGRVTLELDPDTYDVQAVARDPRRRAAERGVLVVADDQRVVRITLP